MLPRRPEPPVPLEELGAWATAWNAAHGGTAVLRIRGRVVRVVLVARVVEVGGGVRGSGGGALEDGAGCHRCNRIERRAWWRAGGRGLTERSSHGWLDGGRAGIQMAGWAG